ncbi:ATP-grasp domain-containing protein [Geobacter sp. SVR]|uniref:ATP-grasp domain-containing protein n=1 Tax=Geobacter sp. SVR TaxID=2495594 RepID=UPI00143F0418|nr:ATP-grasp domain-containing protein [Geobacter sp. SVR]BCS54642.1 hypothetical protein GSVR_29500 [Geobacter sp. SVR]GCF86850.1 carbamoyl phosphate synthase [Geobacter sp. SVR]
MKKINILVTGIGGGGVGEQVLKALRLAKNPDYTIIGTDITEYSAGHRFVDIFCKVPSVSDPSYREVFFSLVNKYKIDFVFHGSEPELQFLSQNRQALREEGVYCYINSADLISLCSNKVETYEKLQSFGFNVPRFMKIDRLRDLDEIDFYPIVLKPYVGSGGSSNVFIALDRKEARLLGSYMLKSGIRIVAQEYLSTHENEYTIGISSDELGNVLGSIVIKKMIGNAMSTRLKVKSNDSLYVISSGFSQGEVCHMADLQKQAENMALALKSKGPLNVQGRVVDGQLMLMEINPRTSGTTSLRAMAGYNEPDMVIKYYANNEKWDTNYEDMVILRGLEEYAHKGWQLAVQPFAGMDATIGIDPLIAGLAPDMVQPSPLPLETAVRIDPIIANVLEPATVRVDPILATPLETSVAVTALDTVLATTLETSSVGIDTALAATMEPAAAGMEPILAIGSTANRTDLAVLERMPVEN